MLLRSHSNARPPPAQGGGGAVQPPPVPPSGQGNGQQAGQLRASLIARQKELEEAQTALEQEHAALERKVRRCTDGGRTRVHASKVNHKIMEDRQGSPVFARASQNIAAAAALLEALPAAATPEEQRTRDIEGAGPNTTGRAERAVHHHDEVVHATTGRSEAIPTQTLGTTMEDTGMRRSSSGSARTVMCVTPSMPVAASTTTTMRRGRSPKITDPAGVAATIVRRIGA